MAAIARDCLGHALGLLGGLAGGALGYYTFMWLVDQGFYGLMIPGAFLGLGCGLLSRDRSLPRGLICGLAGLALGLYCEWRFRPFIADESFTYLVTHLNQKRPITLIMLGLGAVFAVWFGRDGGFRLWAGQRSRGPDGPGSDRSSAA